MTTTRGRGSEVVPIDLCMHGYFIKNTNIGTLR